MPLHKYECRSCGHAFETLVTGRPSDDDARCPACDAPSADRVIGLPSAGRAPATGPTANCRGDGPPCGAPWCGRRG